jgi:hypothetical protein
LPWKFWQTPGISAMKICLMSSSISVSTNYEFATSARGAEDYVNQNNDKSLIYADQLAG